MTAHANIIETRGLIKRYGGLVAIDRLDVQIPAGQITGVIGPNGAGKTTLMGLIGGAILPTEGTVTYDGVDITALKAPDRAQLGIGRTYQIPRPFLGMNVRENLEVAQFVKHPFLSRRLATEQSDRVLERCGLSDVANLPARQLPLLRRKRLEVARALMLEPRLLLLDEVGAGLVDSEIDELIELIHSLADGRTSIVVIEHVLRVVRSCCRNLLVFNFGKKIAEGPTARVFEDEQVAAIYLGTAAKTALVAAAPRPHLALPKQDAVPCLKLEKLVAGYGQARVLNGVSLEVAEGQAVAILGTNGAGKTTLSATIGGGMKPTGGTISWFGRDITRDAGHRRFELGIAHCMEGRRIFADLTIEENLRIAIRNLPDRVVRERLDEIYSLFPILGERRHKPGPSMSGGQLQMLAIGRALVSKPRLAIFDEISLGLAPVVMDQLYETLASLKKTGLTMLIVEQDVDRALQIADHAHVMRQGRIVHSGSAEALMRDGKLKKIYMGEIESV